MTTPEEKKAKALLALERLSRPRNKRRGSMRLSLAPFYLGMAMLVGHQLLLRFVPMVWSATLPGGIQRAHTLRGWGGLLWALCVLFFVRFDQVVLILFGVWIGALVLSFLNRYIRLLVWLIAFAVVMLDFGILFVTLQTALHSGMREAGIG
ncbi:MAG TPA: hypothetical protein VGY53_12760 [Isosphaeraceae bacterium]|nr:hypothetical protein [Isosphaeraceae bacterium]